MLFSCNLLIELFHGTYRYVVLRNPMAIHPEKDEFVFLVTSLTSATLTDRHYQVRWQIDVTFKHLLSNHFDLEAMRVEVADKRNFLKQWQA